MNAKNQTITTLIEKYRASVEALNANSHLSDEEVQPWVIAYCDASSAVLDGNVLSMADAEAAVSYLTEYSTENLYNDACERLLQQTRLFLASTPTDKKLKLLTRHFEGREQYVVAAEIRDLVLNCVEGKRDTLARKICEYEALQMAYDQMKAGVGSEDNSTSAYAFYMIAEVEKRRNEILDLPITNEADAKLKLTLVAALMQSRFISALVTRAMDEIVAFLKPDPRAALQASA